MTHSERQKIEHWLKRLEAARVPVFSQTVRDVSGVADRAETSAHDLARAIGRDAALTARLLKIANSPLFNLQNRRIETISAAVVLLGFDAVRELAVSLSLIEQVLKGRQHVRVTRSMARAFHAAAQARSFALCRKDPCPEEVFVAALLRRLGEMVFWSVAEDEAAAIDRMTAAGSSLEEAEKRVLGFRLETLTRRLVEDWQLGTLLEHAVSGETDDQRVENVALGHEIASAVERFGWDSAEVRRLVSRIATALGLPDGDAMKLVSENVDEAGRIAARFGVPKIEAYLRDGEPASVPEDPAGSTTADPNGPASPNPQLHLRRLQEIGVLLEGRPDLDALAPLVISGIAAGMGFQRVFLALCSPDGRRLLIRHAADPADRGVVELGTSAKPQLFQAVLHSGKALLVTDGNRPTMQPLFSAEVRRWVSTGAFALMPITDGAQAVGLLYADKGAAGLTIDEADFAGFRHFGQQLSLGLARSGEKGGVTAADARGRMS